MKLKVLLQAALLLIVSVCAVQAAIITDVRRNPFHRPPLTSVAGFRQMMAAEQGDIMEGMSQAGYPELYQPLMRQISRVKIRRVSYAPNQQFLWMLSRSERTGQIQVISPMIWGGSGMLTSYEFTIRKDGASYVFATPLVCGNLALKEIIMDAPGGWQPVPEYGQQTEQVQTQQQDCPSCPSCPSDCGQSGCPADCRLPFRLVADAGFLHQIDPANYLFARVGIQHVIDDRLSLLVMAGGAAQVDGDDGDDAFLIDFLLQYDWFRMFAGFGVGGWITSGDKDGDGGDSDLDLIANIGTRIYGHPRTFNTSLFLEARTAADELDSIGDFGRFGAGLRWNF
jgi:hypothetical protein